MKLSKVLKVDLPEEIDIEVERDAVKVASALLDLDRQIQVAKDAAGDPTVMGEQKRAARIAETLLSARRQAVSDRLGESYSPRGRAAQVVDAVIDDFLRRDEAELLMGAIAALYEGKFRAYARNAIAALPKEERKRLEEAHPEGLKALEKAPKTGIFARVGAGVSRIGSGIKGVLEEDGGHASQLLAAVIGNGGNGK